MPEKVSRDMTFGELIRKVPEAGPVLAGYGLHCIGCHIATIETLEQGARAHGLNDEEINKMIVDLNAVAV